VELGAHLPLIDFGDGSRSLGDLVAYARRAATLGFTFLCANDHLVFSRPWLDGPTALAATIDASDGMTLATTVGLPVVRGPAQLAKTLASIDHLSGGRVVAGVGPGSTPRDYAAAGIPFDERWQRLEEAIEAMRALWDERASPFSGRFYSTEDIAIEPPLPREGGPPIWIGSWGSAAGLRRVARLGDGWLASGYNTTPDTFAERRGFLAAELAARGRDPAAFPNGIATMWLYVTDDRRAADAMLADVLSPMLNRPLDALRRHPLPIGSPSACADVLSAYAAAGAQRVFLWPLADEARQLELVCERVVPMLDAGG
jgi:alkanesulfonate monooxygenase SsuD/methylene tetrahydromethanopterin reductase-like flavin-dependent oxidoreductase (luciferase family)